MLSVLGVWVSPLLEGATVQRRGRGEDWIRVCPLVYCDLEKVRHASAPPPLHASLPPSIPDSSSDNGYSHSRRPPNLFICCPSFSSSPLSVLSSTLPSSPLLLLILILLLSTAGCCTVAMTTHPCSSVCWRSPAVATWSKRTSSHSCRYKTPKRQSTKQSSADDITPVQRT